jgi:cell wall assembly regulator SMI1
MCPLKTPDGQSIKSLWEKLERHLRRHHPDLLADLNPPATTAEIDMFQSTLKTKLPAAFVELLMIHNGQRGQADWLFEGEKFLSIEEILMDWRTLCSLETDGDFDDAIADSQEGVKNCWWSKGWVPITSNGFGDHHCLDLDPSPEGERGQIINFFHDSPERSRVASGVSVWFAQFVESKTE